MFADVLAGALGIQISRAENPGYWKKLKRVGWRRDPPEHGEGDFVQLSGTRGREWRGGGKHLPVEFARPEVARILMGYYQSEAAG